MKNKIVDVKNVINACALIENLNNRSAIVPGMGLIHGDSGFGKTTSLQYLFNQETTNGIYIRCCANDTPTSVLNRIAKECGLIPAGRAYQTLDDIIDCIRRNEFSLFVDEADYVVGSKKIMESFRDIYDNTEQPVVLVGMEEIARRISHRKQLHNRISEWVVFQPADLEDVATFAEELMEIDPQITIHDEVLDHIRAKSRGVVRTILSALSKIERAVNGNPPPDGVVTMLDIQSLDLFMNVKRS
ncbi:ATP-binding protein [Vibrio cholerae]|nr:ATP-binding protein [Vibrio cholerae]ELB7341423.1 ATP-binding protein [Vibrio cholerae]ELC9567476.1 ATP-binding protein [Vibrio cholerae]ELK8282264.1 ATP-binding protein [Vibrio cholerae]